MQTKKYFLTNPFNLLMVGLLSIVFVSCGTSRYAAEDGIYGASDSDTQEVATENNILKPKMPNMKVFQKKI